ncbi:beta-lactamase [Fusarium langsethiae]|uniref:Beta-lactamase n=1 Tax=Fusarium langsethiae TaxID=179993 RepID=A0A0M9EMP6_FUSLA|nr:beta-lactamase [Fusarium langsethiae]
MISVLIKHPEGSLFLYETGAGKDYPEVWGPQLADIFASVATKTDIGVYLPTYLQFDLNWKPLYGDSILLARGITVHLCPGHSPGLCILQVNLKDSDTWIFTSDQYIVQENYDNLSTQGWLTRDHAAWSESNQLVHTLQKATRATVILGHDRDVLLRHKLAPQYYK